VASTALKGALGLVVALLLAAGIAAPADVGPMAGMTPASAVTDPAEMATRTVQALVAARSVHLEASISGTLPGTAANMPGATLELTGTRLVADVRPSDGRSRMHLVAPAAGIELDTVSSWDTVWYRMGGPDGSWQPGSLGEVASVLGLDANPLTVVDGVRAWLATSGAAPRSRAVPCGAAAGVCREITIQAGSDPASVLGAAVVAAGGGRLPAADTTLTVLAEAGTLRPLEVRADIRSSDGTVDLHAVIEISGWNEDVVIEDPVPGS
jgi:hypothetical protein